VMEKEGNSSSGMDAQWSEVPVSSPNRRVRQRAEREMGGGGWLGATRRKENGREGGGEARHGTAAQSVGSGWLQVARSEVTACARGGGGLANRGGQQGAGDAVQCD
jgi:hypothetical protein